MTSFETIYKRAIFKFTDYGFREMANSFKEEIMKQYLLSAIAYFQYNCPGTVAYDADEGVFLSDLTNLEIEILSIGLVVNWLSPKLMNSDNLSPQFANSDMKFYSPANQIKETRELYNTIKAEFDGMMRAYSFSIGGIANLKPGG